MGVTSTVAVIRGIGPCRWARAARKVPTLLNIPRRHHVPWTADVFLQGHLCTSGARRTLHRLSAGNEVGFVVQYFALAEDLNIFQNVALPLKYQGRPRKEIREMVTRTLEGLGIADKAKAYPYELSGGQQQRAAIARAIVKEPQLILADEPTGALDEATGEEVQEIFHQLNETGKTILIVTHDAKVAGHCQRIIHMKDGLVQDDGLIPDGGTVQDGRSERDGRPRQDNRPAKKSMAAPPITGGKPI